MREITSWMDTKNDYFKVHIFFLQYIFFSVYSKSIIYSMSWLKFLLMNFVSTPWIILLFHSLNLHLSWAKEEWWEEVVIIAFTCCYIMNLHWPCPHFEVHGTIFILFAIWNIKREGKRYIKVQKCFLRCTQHPATTTLGHLMPFSSLHWYSHIEHVYICAKWK